MTTSDLGAGAMAGAGGSRARSGGLVTVLLIATFGVAIPIVLTAHYGALGIPRSDDWSYSVTLFRLVDDGHLSFNHWVSMSLVGQLLLAAPVAILSPRDLTALQLTTAILGAGGLAAVAATARLLRVGWLGVVLVTGTIAAGPLWGPLTVSFMTDVPAFAFSSVSVMLAVTALRCREISPPMLKASIAVGWFAFTIRQYAIVTVIAILAVAIFDCAARGEQREVRRWLTAAALVTVGTLAFVLWWNSVPDGRSLSPALPRAGSLRTTLIKGAGFVRLIGLLSLPVLVWGRPVVRLRRLWTATPMIAACVGTGVGLWLAATALRVPGDAFVGNYLMRDGALSNIVLVGNRPIVVPSWAWSVMIVVSSVAGIVVILSALPIVVAVLRRIRTRDTSSTDRVGLLLGVAIAGYVLAYSAAMLTGLQVYDRYSLPLVALVSLALARSRPTETEQRAASRAGSERVAGAVAVTALATLAALGIAYTADSASFDGARWHAAEAAVDAGWPARTVNGGFEWRNYHRGNKLPALDRSQPVTPREQVCVTVHINPGSPAGEVIAVAESSAPTRSTARVVAFRTTQPCVGVRRAPRP